MNASLRVRPVGWDKRSSGKASFVHLLDVDDWYDEFSAAPRAFCSALNQSGSFYDTLALAGRPLCQGCLERALKAAAVLEDGQPLTAALGTTVVIGERRRRERRLLDPSCLARLSLYLDQREQTVPLGNRQRLSSLAA